MATSANRTEEQDSGHSQSAVEWAKLEARSRALESENQVLGLAGQVLSELTQLVAAGQDLAALVDRLALLIGNPISVSDQLRQVLACSPVGPSVDPAWRRGARQLRTPRALLRDPTIDEFFRRQQADMQPAVLLQVPAIGLEQRRVVVPILSGDQLLGYLIMLEAEQPIKEFHPTVLQKGALVLALELQKQRANLETEIRLTSEFLSDLFSDDHTDPGNIVRRASFLGMDLLGPWSLVVLDVDDIVGLCKAVQEENPTSARQELVAVLRKRIQGNLPGTILVVHGESIVAFTPVATDPDENDGEPHDLAELLRQEVLDSRLGTTATATDGGIATQLEDFGRRYSKARRTIDVARSLGVEDRTLSPGGLGVYDLLFRADEPNELLRFADRLLEPLVRYDSERNTKLMTTLEAYLNENGAFRKTSRKLFVHLNTLRGRLERIEQTSGIDLSDAKTRFNLQLALEVYRVAQKIEAPSPEQPAPEEPSGSPVETAPPS